MALQLLMRWGCKEKVKFRDFVHSEIVRPPVPTTGHELFIIEIVHHIRLARATPYQTLDPEPFLPSHLPRLPDPSTSRGSRGSSLLVLTIIAGLRAVGIENMREDANEAMPKVLYVSRD
ncbi:hypothetical protein E4U25_001652 [Claviceps purpurea]|nr:hypothetical protein E4U25_001652 [Claviceps purpurea]